MACFITAAKRRNQKEISCHFFLKIVMKLLIYNICV
jgi:hypothetical protein